MAFKTSIRLRKCGTRPTIPTMVISLAIENRTSFMVSFQWMVAILSPFSSLPQSRPSPNSYPKLAEASRLTSVRVNLTLVFFTAVAGSISLPSGVKELGKEFKVKRRLAPRSFFTRYSIRSRLPPKTRSPGRSQWQRTSGTRRWMCCADLHSWASWQ